MDQDKRKSLEAAGWKFGDAADFLGMDEEERRLLELRVQFAIGVRRRREAMKMSQKELGAKLKTSQPRVAKIERAASDVSLDQLVRAFMATGGRFLFQFDENTPPKSKPKKGTTEKRKGNTQLIAANFK